MSESTSWSRRGFLTARGLGSSAGGFFGAVMADRKPPAGGPPARIAHWCVSRRAMACEFSVFLPPSVGDPLPAAEAALDEIERMEDLLSVYRGDNAVAYLNHHAARGPVRVDDRLFRLLKRAARLTEQTEGAFDVSAGALTRAWGFSDGHGGLPGESERAAAMARCGMEHVTLDDRAGTVHYAIPGLEINLGSIGKGYAIDRAVQCMRQEFNVDCTLVQGGRSSLYGLGSPTGDRRGWLVGIQNPFEPTCRVAMVRLRDRALGTSGAANQYFEANGRRYGHVLDPRTGWPVDHLASASVLAADAATADALATALFVMGLDKAADFCHNHPQIAALLVLKPDKAGPPPSSPRVVTFNLPPEDVNLGLDRDPPEIGTVN